MKQAIEAIKAFHKAAEHPIVETPTIPDLDRMRLRHDLIREETEETLYALRDGNLVEIADGIADSIVVLIGTALEYGIPLEKVWAEVHRSNMAKFPGCEGCGAVGTHGVGDQFDWCPDCDGRGTQLILREDGKVMKPEGWTPPDIATALGLDVVERRVLVLHDIATAPGSTQKHYLRSEKMVQKANEEGWTFYHDTLHQRPDGTTDMTYMCSSDYCLCMQ